MYIYIYVYTYIYIYIYISAFGLLRYHRISLLTTATSVFHGAFGACAAAFNASIKNINSNHNNDNDTSYNSSSNNSHTSTVTQRLHHLSRGSDRFGLCRNQGYSL